MNLVMVNGLLLFMMLVWTSAESIYDEEPIHELHDQEYENGSRVDIQARARACRDLGGKCIKWNRECPDNRPLSKPSGKPWCINRRRHCCYPELTTEFPITETSFCEPYTCKFFGSEGRCSQNPIENFVNVGQNQCKDDCTCWIPGWCPNPRFVFSHVCTSCNTHQDALEFTKGRMEQPTTPSATHYVFDGHNITYDYSKFGNATCASSFVTIWACCADSDGNWTHCTSYNPNPQCQAEVGLISGTIDPKGILCLGGSPVC